MLLALAAILFAAFVINVSIGSVGGTPLVGNVGEMVLLLVVATLFTASVLNREAREKSED